MIWYIFLSRQVMGLLPVVCTPALPWHVCWWPCPHLQFQQDATAYPIGSCSLNIMKSALTKLNRINNFCIRLLVGCGGLGSDVAWFRERKFDVDPKNPTCRHCGREQESAEHASCSALWETRLQLISEALPTVSSQFVWTLLNSQIAFLV